MEFIIVKLDPDTREELYADINPHLVDFILLEAITLAGKEMINNPDAMIEASGDDYYHMNDPELDMDSAIRSVLDVMEQVDKEAGVDTTAEDYDVEDKYQFISDKLVLALSSITFANKVGEVLLFHKLVTDPKFSTGVNVKGNHLGNVATLSLSPLVEQDSANRLIESARNIIAEEVPPMSDEEASEVQAHQAYLKHLDPLSREAYVERLQQNVRNAWPVK